MSQAALARLEGFRSRRIGVVGLGREGVDLVQFLSRWGAKVVVSDAADESSLGTSLESLDHLTVDFLLGNQQGVHLLDCDEVFVSPGVPRTAPVVAEATKAGIPISSATALFFELCSGRIAGITGSSGKTTTTALLGSMLRTAEMPSIVAGNIGIPLLGRLDTITEATWCILELSSFQLDDLQQSPSLGTILNITPNHLDRHPDMEDYIRAKGNLICFQHPGDVAVLNADDAVVRELPHSGQTLEFSLQSAVDGVWLDGDQLMMGGELWVVGSRAPGRVAPKPFLTRDQVPLRGIHNVANALAASAAALAIGCPAESISATIRNFQPVPHRLEIVATVRGVTFVNDSIATSPERSMAALKSFDEPIVLIAGGRDKYLSMEDWARLMGERARAVILVGEAADKISAALASVGSQIPAMRTRSFADAVPAAIELAQDGDVVLLSPGCTSFDEFRDFEARGEAFRLAVRQIERTSDAR